jgi:serine/threonine protein phosphatase 1
MANKIWAIGDIHGCHRELMALMKQLEKAGLDYEKDKVIFMGDYIDRGPDSKKVVSQLMKWNKQFSHWVFLYGNHEDILRNWLNFEQKYQEDSKWSCFLHNGGKDTLKSYGISEPIRSKLPKNHVDFLFTKTVYLHEEDDYVFVHAGLVPGTKTILENLNFPDTLIWAREGFIDSTYDWGKKVIFGHSPARKQWGTFGQPIIMKNKIGIDGAVCPSANKNLIAVELPAEKFYFQESFAFYDLLSKMI